jgi:hypothetical protein
VVIPLSLHQAEELRERLMEALLKHVIADVMQHGITIAVHERMRHEKMKLQQGM